jgi:hypothetical protein
LSMVRTGVGMGILLGLLISVLLWVITTPAQAQTAEEVAVCQGKIDTLYGQTETANFIGQNAEKNRDNLQAKLTNAGDKLAEGKNQDAIQKLENFRDTVSLLAAGRKIDGNDATTLIAGANEAITCIRGLKSPTAA